MLKSNASQVMMRCVCHLTNHAVHFLTIIEFKFIKIVNVLLLTYLRECFVGQCCGYAELSFHTCLVHCSCYGFAS